MVNNIQINKTKGFVMLIGGVGTGGGGYGITADGKVHIIPPRTPKVLAKMRDVGILANTTVMARRIADKTIGDKIINITMQAQQRVAESFDQEFWGDITDAVHSVSADLVLSESLAFIVWLGPGGEGGDGGGVGILPGGGRVPIDPWDPRIIAEIRELFRLAEVADTASGISDSDIGKSIRTGVEVLIATKVKSLVQAVGNQVQSATANTAKPSPLPWQEQDVVIVMM